MLIIFIAGIFIILSIIAIMLKEAFSNRVMFHDLTFRDFPRSFENVNIFFISDIHRRKVSKKLLQQLNIKIDIVIIGGDLTEKGVPFQRVKENIQILQQMGAPIFFVWGNNDYEVDVKVLDAMLLQQGVKILVNDHILFESEMGERLYVIGVDDFGSEKSDLNQALKGTNDANFKILVSHNPLISECITPSDRIQLLLSGHTHGGQIRILGFGLYDKGKLKRDGNIVTLISNGYGTTGFPLRLGARSETHVLTIHS